MSVGFPDVLVEIATDLTVTNDRVLSGKLYSRVYDGFPWLLGNMIFTDEGVRREYLEKQEALKRELAGPISLRDHFAGLAMQALVTQGKDRVWIAEDAYAMASAMIQEREKTAH